MSRIRTLAQYVADERDRARREYGITHAEASEFYHADGLRPAWWDYVLDRFNQGDDFSPQAAADLSEAQVRDLSRTTRALRDHLPEQYRKPRQSRPARPRRSSVDEAKGIAEWHGYTVRETDCRDINGTVSLDVSGFGEVIELTYREHPATGYLRWLHGFIHTTVGGDRIPTWSQARRMLASCARPHEVTT